MLGDKRAGGHIAPMTSILRPPIVERRPAPRRRVLLGGMAVYAQGRHSFPCTIRSISPRGARIGFAADQAVPSSFHLINLRDRTVHQASMVWSTRDECGIALKDGVPMDALPHDLHFLKRFSGQ